MATARSGSTDRGYLWTLRVGAFLCFVGHGAFGIMTKPGWVPYFGVVGISPHAAYLLMPWIGAVDIALGLVMLLTPRPAAVYWMMAWAVWTALLRPLAGEPVWEALERAGNYGAPAALIVFMAPQRNWTDAFRPAVFGAPSAASREWARRLLTGIVVLILAGHGILGLEGKRGLITNYESVFSAGASAAVTQWAGVFEIALAVAVAITRWPRLLYFVAVWKLATESLFLSAGGSMWELVERGGSYAAPIALALLLLGGRPDPDPRATPHPT
jgi:hypothetical protein